MARPTAQIFIFLLCLNAAVTAWGASGVAGDWGVDPSTGAEEEINKTQKRADDVGKSSPGEASFFIGVVTNVLGNAFNFVAGITFGAPLMFENLGVPSWITAFVFAPMYGLIVLDGIYLLTGRGF